MLYCCVHPVGDSCPTLAYLACRCLLRRVLGHACTEVLQPAQFLLSERATCSVSIDRVLVAAKCTLTSEVPVMVVDKVYTITGSALSIQAVAVGCCSLKPQAAYGASLRWPDRPSASTLCQVMASHTYPLQGINRIFALHMNGLVGSLMACICVWTDSGSLRTGCLAATAPTTPMVHACRIQVSGSLGSCHNSFRLKGVIREEGAAAFREGTHELGTHCRLQRQMSTLIGSGYDVGLHSGR